jgi:pyruvate/2-oxoglutarate/acetoin dehydrogenase E1 component
MSSEDMESELEAANTQEAISIDIAQLQTLAKEDIQAVETKIQETLATLTAQQQADLAASLDEEVDKDHWLVKLIKELFSGIIEV